MFAADRLAADPALLGPLGRAALLTNDAARTAGDPERRTRVALREAGVPLVRLLGPEHGLTARAPDGAPVADGHDPLTSLPVVSLYGERLGPGPEALDDIDTVLVDLPDVGARFYTYAWSLYHTLHACAAAGRRLVVLDRPNLTGGDLALVEGPLLDLAHRSFIGDAVLPVRHALTLGELARHWARTECPTVRLDVLPAAGWTRAMPWEGTGLPWVPPSPGMPSLASARSYPGVCLFEATNLSVGRGTPWAFTVVGAPWLDAVAVATRSAGRLGPGVALAPTRFVPQTGPWMGEPCEGIQLTVTEPARFRPVRAGLALLAAVIGTHRLRFQWARYPTVANPSGNGHFERLIGRSGIRTILDTDPDGVDAGQLADWTAAPSWPDDVAPALLYP